MVYFWTRGSLLRAQSFAFILFLHSSSLITESVINHKTRALTKEQYQALSSTVLNLVLLQNQLSHHNGASTVSHPVIVIIVQQETWAWARRLQDRLARFHGNFLLTEYLLDAKTTQEKSVSIIVQNLEKQMGNISSVVLYLENVDLLLALIAAVCSSTYMKWTPLLHRTEWILISTKADSPRTYLGKNCCPCFDFLTLVISMEKGIGILRKSKGSNYSPKDITFFQHGWTLNELKNEFQDLTMKKNNRLEGMTIPVGVRENEKQMLLNKRFGNETKFNPYAEKVLMLLAAAMKFNFTRVSPTDGGGFGAVQKDGRVTGIAGLVARKEVAFSCVGLAKTINMLQAIDYSDSPILHSPVFLTYKLPDKDDQIDLTLTDIVQPDFYLTLLGPILILFLLGAFMHVWTRSCSLVTPTKPSKRELRKLALSFPSHLFFHVDKTYAGQTGRVLRGTWAIFCFILTAAYSAYLTTSFTVKPKELKLDTLEKLLQNPQYRFGMANENAAFLQEIENCNDSISRKAWHKLRQFNRTDPSVMSSDRKVQSQHVLKGNYAFLDTLHADDIAEYEPGDRNYLKVRSYRIRAFQNYENGYLVFPKDAFFKDSLNTAITTLYEAGILRHLQERSGVARDPALKSYATSLEREKPVSISRVLIIVYMCLAGTGLAWFCLLVEHLMHIGLQRLPRRQRYHK